MKIAPWLTALKAEQQGPQATEEQEAARRSRVLTGISGYFGGMVVMGLLMAWYNVRLTRRQKLEDKERADVVA